MFGFNSISAGAFSDTYISAIGGSVAPINLLSASPSIGISEVPTISFTNLDYDFSATSVVEGDVGVIWFTLPIVSLNSTVNVSSTVSNIVLATATGTFAASKANVVTVPAIGLNTFSAILAISSKPIVSVPLIAINTLAGIVSSSVSRSVVVPSIGVTNIPATISASYGSFSLVDSVDFSTLAAELNVSSFASGGTSSINFGAMEIAHTFTYRIKDSVVIMLQSRDTNIICHSRSANVVCLSRPTKITFFPRNKLN